MSDNDLIPRLQTATVGDMNLDRDIHSMLGLPLGIWKLVPAYTTDFSQAYSLLPSTVTNFDLFSHIGNRQDITGDCWGCKVHDQLQLVGTERAKRQIKRLYQSLNGKPPTRQIRITVERAIAEQYSDFAATHAATPQLAICIVALKVRIGRTVDDDDLDKS